MTKNEKYYADLLKYYEKNKKIKFKTKLNLFHKINVMIDRASLPRNVFINPITIIILCILRQAKYARNRWYIPLV